MHTVLHTDPEPKGSRSDAAHRELKRALLCGEFAINVPLIEERLAVALEVSRTPVREALLRLHGEGLLVRGPDGRFRPTAPDVEVMQNLYEVREQLEVQGINRPASSGVAHDRDVLAELRDEWRSYASEPVEPSPDFVLLDESFHVTVAESAGNPVLADLLRQINERIRVVRMQDFLTAERIERTVAEHLGIVEALLADELDVATVRFRDHLNRSVEVVEARTIQALSRMVNGGRR
jgi:DNA-binding GntR family transcriptional regulator